MKFIFTGIVALLFSIPAQATLIFTEIMYDPKNTPESEWEWIEIYNSASTAIDLSGYVLDDDDYSQRSSSNITAGSISANSYAVLYNSSNNSFSDAWEAGIDLIAVSNWPSIANGLNGDMIGLWDSYASYSGDHKIQAQALLSLSIRPRTPWPTNNDQASIYLTDITADMTDPTNWAISTAGVNNAYSSTNSDIGSPGRGATVSPVPLPAGFILLISALGLLGLRRNVA